MENPICCMENKTWNAGPCIRQLLAHLRRIFCDDANDWGIRQCDLFLEVCRHHGETSGSAKILSLTSRVKDRKRDQSLLSPPLIPPMRHSHTSKQNRRPVHGAFGDVYLSAHSTQTPIDNIHPFAMLLNYVVVQSIERNVQAASREGMFATPNASIFAICRKMRFLTNTSSVSPSRPGFNHSKLLV